MDLINKPEKTMSSLEISKLIGKKHSHVMRDVRRMIENIKNSLKPDMDSVDKSEYNRSSRKQYKFLSDSTIKVFMDWATNDSATKYKIYETSYKDGSGKSNNMYVLNKKASYLLASGYDVVLRASIIDRWEELENKQQQVALPKRTARQELRLQQTALITLIKQYLLRGDVTSVARAKGFSVDSAQNVMQGKCFNPEIVKAIYDKAIERKATLGGSIQEMISNLE